MIFKSLLLAFAAFSGANAARQSRGGLDLEGLMKFLEDAPVNNLRGPENPRRLQTVVGDNGETTTKEEIQAAIQDAIGATNGGKGPYDSCLDLFNAFDSDGDGLLTATELGEFFANVMGANDAYAEQLGEALIEWYDYGGEGTLDAAELEAACKGGKDIESHSMV